MTPMRFKNALMVGCVILLLTVLFLKTRGANLENHIQVVDRLRALKEEEIRLDRNILRLRFGIVQNYDAAAHNIQQLKKIFGDIQKGPFRVYRQGRRELDEDLESYGKSLKDQELLFEDFSTENAVLNNSLHYFPVLSVRILQQLASIPDSGPLQSNLNSLLRNTLAYEIIGDEEWVRPSQDLIRSLNSFPTELSVHENLVAAGRHAEVIFKNKKEVGEILLKLGALESIRKVEQIEKTYTFYFEKTLRESNVYRLVLYLLCLGLSGYALFILLRLQWTTTELQRVNETLEKRVKQRTFDLEKSNQALLQEEQKLRKVVEAAPNGILTLDEKGDILLVNSRLEKMFGYDRHELQGQKIEILLPDRYHLDHVGKRQKYFQALVPRKMGSGLDLYALRKDGSEFPVDISLSPIQVLEQSIVLATIDDLTERKHLENIALQSEKMSAVGQLAAGVAHEINNPLGVILGFSQSAIRRLAPNDPFELPFKSIEREALRCKQLVHELLTFSRMGKIEKEDVDLNEMIESSFSLILAQSKVKNTQLVKELAPTLPKISANKNQLQQVLINLCNNAMDAMPNGGIITVRTKQSTLNNKEAVEIQVQDTGQGIPKEIQKKIFEPFFTTKAVGKGTGLGLSLIFEIIQKHAGYITVDSEPGKGALFKVYLPSKVR